MKKFIVLITILGFSVSVFALSINECKTDIYFGNGVWNTEKSADISRKALDDLIKDEIIKNNPSLQTKYGEVKLAYNRGQGWDVDLVETFYQLKEAGRLSEWEFFT